MLGISVESRDKLWSHKSVWSCPGCVCTPFPEECLALCHMSVVRDVFLISLTWCWSIPLVPHWRFGTQPAEGNSCISDVSFGADHLSPSKPVSLYWSSCKVWLGDSSSPSIPQSHWQQKYQQKLGVSWKWGWWWGTSKLTELEIGLTALWLGNAHKFLVFSLFCVVKQGGENGEETAPERGRGRIIKGIVSTVTALFSLLSQRTLRISGSAWKW